MRASAEWQLQTSAKQRYLDRAALLVFMILVVWILPLPFCISVFGIAPVIYFLDLWSNRQRCAVSRIGYSLKGLLPQWWLEKEGRRQCIQWRNGSVRRRELIILRWSFWPWNRVILRADSFADQEQFRQLKMALYQSL